MPNHLQLLFLASFLLTFIILLTLSNLLSSKLRDAGYDISNLVLIGLPKSEHSHPHSLSPNQMATSAPSFLDVRQSVVAQLIVLLLAAASSAFMYLKFGRTGTSSFPTWLPTLSYSLQLFSQEGCSRSKGMATIPSQRKDYHFLEHCPVCALLTHTSTILTSDLDIALAFHAQMMSLVSPLASIYPSPQR